MGTFATAMTATMDAVELELDRLLPPSDAPEGRVVEAMRYATLGGGKRLRPFLVLSAGQIFDVAVEHSLRAAVAVEMVHAYSLVHDDLPAMDDDKIRRGRPTCHVAFDEATAILAGDALLTKAFEVLADPETHPEPEVRADLVLALAKASGDHGMVGGQMFDILAPTLDIEDVAVITRLQQMKTGRLFAFSCEAGAILGKADDSARLHLQAYAHDMGLAFQIADDLLDVEGDADQVGKATGKDEDQGKATFVSLMGVDRARDQAHMLVDQAIAHLDSFGEKAEHLRQAARFVVEREF